MAAKLGGKVLKFDRCVFWRMSDIQHMKNFILGSGYSELHFRHAELNPSIIESLLLDSELGITKVILESIDIYDENEEQTHHGSEEDSNTSCCIQSMEVLDIQFPAMKLSWMLQLPLPNLKQLKLVQSSEESQGGGWTEFVVTALRTLTSLDHLSVKEMALDDDAIKTALKVSPSNAFFDYRKSSRGRRDDKIAILSGVNRYGRFELRKPTATLSFLFQRICAMQKDVLVPVELKLSVLFMLLSEAPALWATPPEADGHPSGQENTAASVGQVDGAAVAGGVSPK